jgi:hypothetical protein
MGITESPWVAEQYANVSIFGGNDEICEMLEGDQVANAQLVCAAPIMLQALQDLCAEIKLGKLNVRRDFHLMNAHACALKAIYQAEGGEQ